MDWITALHVLVIRITVMIHLAQTLKEAFRSGLRYDEATLRGGSDDAGITSKRPSGDADMDLRMLQEIPPWDWPAGTDRAILDMLRDSGASASDRLLAAELAGDFTVINDELAKDLLSILSSGEEDEELRCQAALSLGPALEYADTDGFDENERDEDRPISEPTFHEAMETLHKLYDDATIPKEVRRRILESSIRAPQDWHRQAVQTAYASDDEAWKLTAVFCMRFMRGFDEQILEALSSMNPDTHYEAVCAAGNWGLNEAWPHVIALVNTEDLEKRLLLAAIEAVAGIRPNEAFDILADYADDEDEDIAEAARDALAMTQEIADEYDDEEDDETYH